MTGKRKLFRARSGLWGVITAPCRKFWEAYGLTGIS
jgi:hypothetical protein